MSKFYSLLISSQYNRRHHKWGKISCVVSKGSNFSWRELYERYGSFREAKELVEKIYIEIKEEPGEKPRPYPDFLAVEVAFEALNPRALQYVKHKSIPCFVIPTVITGDDHEYNFVVFNQVVNVDMKASNLIKKDNIVVTQGKNYISSEIVLKKPPENFRGIASLDVLPNRLVCDEITKQELEKERFTGLIFKEIKTS